MPKAKGTNNTDGNNSNTRETDNKQGAGNGTGTGIDKTKENNGTKSVHEKNLVDDKKAKAGKPNDVVIEVEGSKKPPRPKKSTAEKKKAQQDRINKKQEKEMINDISSLLGGVGLVASLKFGGHWELSEDETKQIAEPLSKILGKYNLLGKVSEMSDPMALVIACGTIIAPRVMISMSEAKGNKKQLAVLTKNGAISEESRSNTISSESSIRVDETSHAKDDTQSIKSSLVEIQG